MTKSPPCQTKDFTVFMFTYFAAHLYFENFREQTIYSQNTQSTLGFFVHKVGYRLNSVHCFTCISKSRSSHIFPNKHDCQKGWIRQIQLDQFLP